MALIDDLRRVLTEKFPGAELNLKRIAGGRVGGAIVWSGFDRQSQIDRQTSLRRAIDASLEPAQQLQVSFIMTLTPDEETVLTKQ